MWLREKKDREDNNYGPEYGIDYARFSDKPDLAADKKLLAEVSLHLQENFPEQFETITVFVQNGFVFLKGEVSDFLSRIEIGDKVARMPRVQEVVNQILVKNFH